MYDTKNLVLHCPLETFSAVAFFTSRFEIDCGFYNQKPKTFGDNSNRGSKALGANFLAKRKHIEEDRLL